MCTEENEVSVVETGKMETKEQDTYWKGWIEPKEKGMSTGN